jgi:hypothetical protein
LPPRKIRLQTCASACKSLTAPPFGDPYKYSDDPTADHNKIQPQPGPFNDVIGDGFFEDDDYGDPNDFQFEDLIPFLEEEEEYDLDAAFRCYKADADYQDEGEDDPQVPSQPQQGDGEEDKPPIQRSPSPADQCSQITMPRQQLLEERGKEEGADGGEVWQTPPLLDTQREFYSALLDKIEHYTEAAEAPKRRSGVWARLSSFRSNQRYESELRS